MTAAAPASASSALDPAHRRGYVAAVLAWLLPGAGHFYLGRRGRGLVMAVCSIGMLLTGLLVDGRLYSLGERVTLYRLGGFCEAGFGPLYFILRGAGLSFDPASPLTRSLTSGNGAVFLVSAGLMNYLMAMDCFDLAIGRRR